MTDTFTNASCEEAFKYGDATLKVDGTAVAVINGKLYTRYDAKLDKQGNPKPIPEGAIPCCERDPVTGHMPCWVLADLTKSNSCKWHVAAYEDYLNKHGAVENGTYEAIGRHFRSNPYKLDTDTLYRHGSTILHDVPRTYDAISAWLKEYAVEGIVFWYNGEPVCKIRRTDFMYAWNDGTDLSVLKQISF